MKKVSLLIIAVALMGVVQVTECRRGGMKQQASRAWGKTKEVGKTGVIKTRAAGAGLKAGWQKEGTLGERWGAVEKRYGTRKAELRGAAAGQKVRQMPGRGVEATKRGGKAVGQATQRGYYRTKGAIKGLRGK